MLRRVGPKADSTPGMMYNVSLIFYYITIFCHLLKDKTEELLRGSNSYKNYRFA